MSGCWGRVGPPLLVEACSLLHLNLYCAVRKLFLLSMFRQGLYVSAYLTFWVVSITENLEFSSVQNGLIIASCFKFSNRSSQVKCFLWTFLMQQGLQDWVNPHLFQVNFPPPPSWLLTETIYNSNWFLGWQCTEESWL